MNYEDEWDFGRMKTENGMTTIHSPEGKLMVDIQWARRVTYHDSLHIFTAQYGGPWWKDVDGRRLFLEEYVPKMASHIFIDATSEPETSTGQCPDCKGTGLYVGLITTEPCKGCARLYK